jgi:hypothetical protein
LKAGVQYGASASLATATLGVSATGTGDVSRTLAARTSDFTVNAAPTSMAQPATSPASAAPFIAV